MKTMILAIALTIAGTCFSDDTKETFDNDFFAFPIAPAPHFFSFTLQGYDGKKEIEISINLETGAVQVTGDMDESGIRFFTDILPACYPDAKKIICGEK